jgi:DNA-binding Xre family transcriptional regulator
MYLLRIKNLAEKRAGGIRKLAADIGMSEANIHRCISANKIQAGDLEKIAQIFNVPVGYFFDDEIPAKQITQKDSNDIVMGKMFTVNKFIADELIQTLKTRDKQINELIKIISDRRNENRLGHEQ